MSEKAEVVGKVVKIAIILVIAYLIVGDSIVDPIFRDAFGK